MAGREDNISIRFHDASGNPIGTGLTVNSSTTGKQEVPAITKLSIGSMVVVWEDGNPAPDDTSASAIRGQIISATGDPINPQLRINTTTTSAQRDPSVAALDDGTLSSSGRMGSQKAPDNDGMPFVANAISALGEAIGNEFLVNNIKDGNQARPMRRCHRRWPFHGCLVG